VQLTDGKPIHRLNRSIPKEKPGENKSTIELKALGIFSQAMKFPI